MDTMVLEREQSAFLVNVARLVTSDDDLQEAASDVAGASDFKIGKTNPFVTWIAGDFVEADNPNQNTQFWTAADLSLSEYSITHAPLNMVHKFREPIGFYAATKTVKFKREADTVLAGDAAAAVKQGLKIKALAGLWSHIFPFEDAQARAADESGLLFYSMECRGTHLTCGTDKARKLEGCGETFDYMAVNDHCEHLKKRTSVRHIVKPTFRGGALIVPPMRPGWKNANASILDKAIMQEAAAFAQQTEDQYKVLNAGGADLTASAWEQMMALVVISTKG